MKRWFILKGFHISTFIPRLFWFNGKLEQTYLISFNDSCRYSIEERSCVNKLFGYCFGLFQVHKNSVRFGWTYDKSVDKIVIWIYVYDNGKLVKKPVFECDVYNRDYKFSIKTCCNKTVFYIEDEEVYRTNVTIPSKIIPTLGFYFGGNTKAPHNMFINYKKKNNYE